MRQHPKATAGGAGVIVGILAFAQRLGNYENKPLAVALLIIAGALLVGFCFLAVRDTVRWIGGAVGQGTEFKPSDQITADHGGVAILGNVGDSKVIGTQNIYTQAVERKPKAKVVHEDHGFLLVNEGPGLFEVNLVSRPIGIIDLKWELVHFLPEDATAPLSYSLWKLNGSDRIEVGFSSLVSHISPQPIITVVINCQDENRHWWNGAGVLIYDRESQRWNSSGFANMRPLGLGDGEGGGRVC
jgi:hypothetical protein